MESTFQRRLKNLTLEELSKICELMSRKNKASQYLFKDIENEIFSRDLEGMSIEVIDRFLYGFSHASLGSPRLFGFFQKLVEKIYNEVPA